MIDDSEKLGESVARKRCKKESPGSSPVETTESQLQLSQPTQPEENFDVTQATQPEENSDENFDASQMTQCSPLQSMTQTSPVKSINSVLLAEESPETGLALALQRPREHAKYSRVKRVTTSTGLLPANCTAADENRCCSFSTLRIPIWVIFRPTKSAAWHMDAMAC